MPKIPYSVLYEDAVDNILKTRSIKKLDNVLWEPYYHAGSTCSKACGKGIKILILNAPCNGFGDLIFGLKLSNYLRQWYGAEVTIATTYEKGLLGLGVDPKYVVGVMGGKQTQCRKFSKMKLNKKIPIQDLIFNAPIQSGFDPDLKDVKKMVPYATIWNTFYFSEYNDHLDKNFTFNTGVGRDRDGVLLTRPTTTKGRPAGLKNPYALIYVAESLRSVDTCIMSFVEMIAKKYHKKHHKLDVVVPPWFADEDLDNRLRKQVSKYYPNIIIVGKKETIVVSEGDRRDPTLTFRADILPVPNKLMMQLMSNSVNDILLTGDQSITDALSCCSHKNIFYQIAPWKSDLAKNLAKELPNAYMKKVSTSCGTLKAISYKSNYSKFIKKWDFRTRARGKLDAIVLSALAIKRDDRIADLNDLVTTSRSLPGLKKKLKSGGESKPQSKSSRRKSKLKSRRRKSTHKSRSKKRRSKKKSKKKCNHGMKKDGYCKKKPGPKKW